MSQELSIGRLIGHFSRARPDTLALAEDDTADAMTWAELDRATNRLARAWASP